MVTDGAGFIIKDGEKEIWEGWRVCDFVEVLEASFHTKSFSTKDEVREWCKNDQPYLKKHIPAVANHFIKKACL